LAFVSGAPLTFALGGLVLGMLGYGVRAVSRWRRKGRSCPHLFFLRVGFVVPVQICGLLACRFCLCFVGCGSRCLGGCALSGFCGVGGLAGVFRFGRSCRPGVKRACRLPSLPAMGFAPVAWLVPRSFLSGLCRQPSVGRVSFSGFVACLVWRWSFLRLVGLVFVRCGCRSQAGGCPV